MPKQLPKGWKWLVVAGLLIALLSLIKARRGNNQDGFRNRQVIRQSPYKALERFIIAQAKHESQNFTSRVYKANNNPFGFKEAKKRQQIGKLGSKAPKTEGGNYWNYPNDTEAFKDLLVYFDKVNFPKKVSSALQYVTELKNRNYFTDSLNNYLNGINRWL